MVGQVCEMGGEGDSSSSSHLGGRTGGRSMGCGNEATGKGWERSGGSGFSLSPSHGLHSLVCAYLTFLLLMMSDE